MVTKKELGDFESLSIFNEDYLLIKRNGLFNLMDNNGEYVSKTWFKDIKKNDGGGADFIEVKQEKPVQLRSVSLIKSYSAVRSVLNDTTILPFLDTRCINIITPYKVRSYSTHREITIIAKVKLFDKELLLGKNGKLYENYNGEVKEYIMPTFFISYTDINRLVDVADKFNCIYNSKYNKNNKEDDSSWDNLYKHNSPCFMFGFGNESYVFGTDYKSTVMKTTTSAWGGDTIKVRFVKDLLGECADKFITRIEELGYHGATLSEHPVWTKKYKLADLDTLFSEMKELSNKLNFA